MRVFGIILLAFGLIGILYSGSIDTTMLVFGVEVVNPVAINDQQQGYIISAFLMFLGAVLIFIGSDSKPKEHTFKKYEEQARKAEKKGQVPTAIENYQDAIFHLENDYKGLQKKDLEGRDALISSFNSKIELLKSSTIA